MRIQKLLYKKSPKNNLNDNQESPQISFTSDTTELRKSKDRDRHLKKENRRPVLCEISFFAQKTVCLVRCDNAERPDLAEWMTTWGCEVIAVPVQTPEDIYVIDLDAVSLIVLSHSSEVMQRSQAPDLASSLAARTAQRIRQANCDIPILLVGEKLKTATFTAAMRSVYDATLTLPTTKTDFSLAISAASTKNCGILSDSHLHDPVGQTERPNIRRSSALQHRSAGDGYTAARSCSSWINTPSGLVILISIALAALVIISERVLALLSVNPW